MEDLTIADVEKLVEQLGIQLPFKLADLDASMLSELAYGLALMARVKRRQGLKAAVSKIAAGM